MTANVLATTVGGILSTVFLLMAGAVLRFAKSVSSNTKATAENTKTIADLAVAVETQHSTFSRRLKRLERTKTTEHAELMQRIAALEGRDSARGAG
jgi:hypothetical protein